MLHVHVYVRHDHPDHHHGPAAHGHGATHHHHGDHETLYGTERRGSRAGHADEQTTVFDACNPGDHAVQFVFTCIRADAYPVLHLTSIVSGPLAPTVEGWWRVAPSDVRAHSPPRLTDGPLRAPPVVHLA
jgi:hypothetical protein